MLEATQAEIPAARLEGVIDTRREDDIGVERAGLAAGQVRAEAQARAGHRAVGLDGDGEVIESEGGRWRGRETNGEDEAPNPCRQELFREIDPREHGGNKAEPHGASRRGSFRAAARTGATA